MNLEPSNQLYLFGHQENFINLTNLYINKSFPNKILLSGEKGIGKSTLAFHLINYILSQDEEHMYNLEKFEINPENKSFKLLKNKSNPNFILIDINEEKKSIDIGQIRNLILTLNKSNFNKKPRLVLIDNIELLNNNAVNALLKILEEPGDNINFILINNNKKILPTLKSRCLNFNIKLTSEQSFEITSKLLNEKYSDLINNEIISNYSTPGEILRLIDFSNNNDISLKELNLKTLIQKLITEKKYKKDNFIKLMIYSLIEKYFRNNISISNITLIAFHKYFLKRINDTKLFNLDEEALFMEFESKILNG